jgi:protein-disulfide isomerase
VWKNNPLPFHNNAMPAAEAAMAAHAQGKFWEMHAKLFENQKALDASNLEKYAQELGLNMAKFKADMESHKYKAQIEADQKAGATVGARGTPAFFINGRFLSGAQPIDNFKKIIDAEIAKADETLKKGVPLARLYDELQKNALAQVAAGAAPGAAPGAPPGSDVRVAVDVGNSPAKGPKTAAVTIVEFSDFECPFCSRVVPTLHKIMEEYKGKVRVAFKQYPLPFHKSAGPAAEAAMAAHAQGKFWEMHDKLFENNKALDAPSLEKYAQEIGLNVAKFKADMESRRYESAVKADVEYGKTLGQFGTPTFFINGRKVSGALPFESFKQIIDEELKKPAGPIRGAARPLPIGAKTAAPAPRAPK